MTPSEILIQAAEWLEQHEWCQGHYQRDGASCAVGAIERMCRRRLVVEAARRKLANFLNTPMVTAWNDAPGRTKAQVIAVLRAAAGETR